MPIPQILQPEEYFSYYATYLEYIPVGADLTLAFTDSQQALKASLKSFAEADASFAYAPGKWTVAQALQHIIDTERIFSYRALTFARGDAGPLPGFDQDVFAATVGQPKASLQDLAEEFSTVRRGTQCLFAGLDEEALRRGGRMSGHWHSVHAIGFICIGHVYHHAAIFHQRYQRGVAPR